MQRVNVPVFPVVNIHVAESQLFMIIKDSQEVFL